MEDNREVLCGANSYEQKYYFNENYKKLPQSIQEELRIICVLFTEDVGGLFTMVFADDGMLMLETIADEGDYLYDDISAGLLVRKVQDSRRELFESISFYYKAMNGQLNLDEIES